MYSSDLQRLGEPGRMRSKLLRLSKGAWSNLLSRKKASRIIDQQRELMIKFKVHYHRALADAIILKLLIPCSKPSLSSNNGRTSLRRLMIPW
mmetsp:Transcript_2348/g.3538  ORF Transcript_2348/g.3538 Transcript_2348/m.3538 type:complete len:92 (-) Transcript_2348:1709-1984(-)